MTGHATHDALDVSFQQVVHSALTEEAAMGGRVRERAGADSVKTDNALV